MGERYDFTDVWTVPASIALAWRMVDDVAAWPKWWSDYRMAEIVSDVKHGTGTRWHVGSSPACLTRLTSNSLSSSTSRPLTSRPAYRVSLKARSIGVWKRLVRTR